MFTKFNTHSQKMCSNQFSIKLGKVSLVVGHRIVLGYVISSNGIEVVKAKVHTIHGLPSTIIMMKVHSFLNHVGFYRTFILEFLKIARPLCIQL